MPGSWYGQQREVAVARGGALVLGRALHGPWNEGTRVIGRNIATIAAPFRPVRAVSLTQHQYLGQAAEYAFIEHVPAHGSYGAVSDYLSLARLARHIDRVVASMSISIAHLTEVPLALAPWLHRRGIRVIVHRTIVEQPYLSPVERFRASAGWRVFDPWIDAYALSSPALFKPLAAKGVAPAKMTLVPAPIDTNLYQPGDKATVRARLGLNHNELLVLYVGTLSPLRFPTPIIREGLQRAAAQLGAPIRLIGFAPAKTHAYNQQWYQEVHGQLQAIPGVTATINLADLTDSEKAAWFQAADLVLVPFTAPVAIDPPLTMVEAMACGALVLATPQANRSALIDTGCNGLLFETASDLAQALCTYHQRSQAWAAQLCRSARATVLQRHSFRAATEAMTLLWDKLERGTGHADKG